MKTMVMIMVALFGLSFCASAVEKIAVQIVYDGSGSMSQVVTGSDGRNVRKCDAARKAFRKISDQVGEFVKNNPDKEVDVGVLIFNNGDVREIVRLKPYNRKTMYDAYVKLPDPNGGTPLGESLQDAYKKLPGDSKCHIFVLTDGDENGSVHMVDVVKEQKAKAGLYFVAFDVNGAIFNDLKSLGAYVTEASNEKELFSRVQTVFATKILLEKEE